MIAEVTKNIIYKSTQMKHPIKGLFGYKIQGTLFSSDINKVVTDETKEKLAFNYLMISLLKNNKNYKKKDNSTHLKQSIDRISNEFSVKYNIEQDKLNTLSEELEIYSQDIDDKIWIGFTRFRANEVFTCDDNDEKKKLPTIISKNSEMSISKYHIIQGWLKSNNLQNNIIVPKSIFTQYKLFTEHTMHTHKITSNITPQQPYSNKVNK